MKKLILFLLPLSLLATNLQAQSYSINWYKIAGGGGTSAGTIDGTVYSVSGTIGQPDASKAMTGGQYSLTGGFWSLVSVVQTANAPAISITHTGRTVTLSWANVPGFTLQQNANLALSNWVASAFAVSTNDATESVTITNTTGTLFFRLVAPIVP